MWLPLALILVFGRHGAGAQPAPGPAVLSRSSKHCPKGKFITTHEVQTNVFVFACHWCPQGKYQGHSGTRWHQMCFSCPAGKYTEYRGRTGCKACPTGRYMRPVGTGAAAVAVTQIIDKFCAPCAAGRASPNVGATSADVCEACAGAAVAHG